MAVTRLPRHTRATLLLALTAAACTPAEPTPIEAYLDAFEARGLWNGAALVAEHGEIMLARGTSGDSATRMPAYAADVAFPIASITKTFTATAILQLVQQGALTVDAPVASILPAFPYPDITLRQLLSHTSGLPPYNAFLASTLAAHPDTVFQNADLIPAMFGHPVPPLYSAGSDGNYDNINYIVLALVIEQASGMPYQTFIATHILEPAGMTRTQLMPLADILHDRTTTSFATPRLFPHIYSDTTTSVSTIPYVVSYWSAYRFLGFGDYISTTRDLLSFHDALASGTLVDTTLLRRAYTPVHLTDGRVNGGHFGLGWQVNADTSDGLIVSHPGASVGLSIAFIRDLSHDRVVVVFDNGHYSAGEIGAGLLRQLAGDTVPFPTRPLATQLGRRIMTVGTDSALAEFDRLRADTAEWRVDENALNLLGYDLFGQPGAFELPVVHHYNEAAAVFRLNTTLYPASWNVWDSFAESLAALGQRDSAIVMYRKSLELNPGNPSSTAGLTTLEGDGEQR